MEKVKVTVTFELGDQILHTATKEINADILALKRQRVFQFEHDCGKFIGLQMPIVFEAFDNLSKNE